MTERYPATEMLRQLGDVPISDALYTASMYECRARDCLAESRIEERAGRKHAAAVFRRQFDEDMQRAREVLAASVRDEVADVA